MIIDYFMVTAPTDELITDKIYHLWVSGNFPFDKHTF